MSLFSKVARFARTPQGRRLTQRAVRMANDPKTKRQIESARTRLMKKR